MCNCGNKRSELPATANANKQSLSNPTQKMGPGVNYMYTGQSALTITGNVTGIQYRFSNPGNQQQIDYRDAPSMAMVPVLKRIG